MLKPYCSAPENTCISLGSSVMMNCALNTRRQQLLEEHHRIELAEVDLDLAVRARGCRRTR